MTTKAPVACHKCGLTTTVPSLLISIPSSHRIGSNPDRHFCPRCIENHQGPLVIMILGIYALALGFYTLLLASGNLTNVPGGPYTLKNMPLGYLIFPLFFLVNVPLIFLHECAHALVGWCVGLDVHGISLGNGRRWARLRLGRFLIDLNEWPFCGMCYVSAPSDTKPWKWGLMAAAGPAVHLIIILLMLPRLPTIEHAMAEAHMDVLWGLLFLSNVILLASNLAPFRVKIGTIYLPTDGRQLLDLFRDRVSLEHITAGHYYAHAIWSIDAAATPVEAAAIVDRLLPTLSFDPSFQVKALQAWASCGRWGEVINHGTEWANDTPPPSKRAQITAWTALGYVYSDHHDLVQAAAFGDMASEIAPWDSTIQIACAAVSLARREDAESEQWLRQADTTAPFPAAAIAWIRAELHNRHGNTVQVQKWEAQARKLDPLGAFRYCAASTLT